jgi:hypothetical protein
VGDHRPAGRDPVLWLVALLAALAVLGPAVGPHLVLLRDMVVVPRMSWLPEWFGLGASLPRAVPQDAVSLAASAVAPGWVWQQAQLLGALVLGGVGAARLAVLPARAMRVAAVVLAIWNPWVSERLLQGNLSILVAYGALPWLLDAARRQRRGDAGAVWPLLGWTALGSLVPSAGVLTAALAAAVALGPGTRARRRTWTAAALVVLELPWLVPALVHPAAGSSDAAGAEVFGLRGEGPWGPLVTALSGGGAWNSDVVLPSRGWWTSAVLGLVLVGLAAAGWRGLARAAGRAVPTALLVAAAVALGWGLLTALAPGAAAAVVSGLPGGGLLRDAHKWLAPLVLLVTAAAPWGLLRVPRVSGDVALRTAAAAGLALVPLLALPDLGWGASGRLGGTALPSGYDEVRTLLASDPRPGDVAVLPWPSYRAFRWNARRPSGDPAPRLLPRTSVVDDRLLVERSGRLVVVSGEDPRAAAVTSALGSGTPLAQVLPSLGVGFVLVEDDTPGAPPEGALVGLRPVLEGAGVRLLAVPTAPSTAPSASSARVVAVAAADVLAVVLLLGAGLAAARRVALRDARP